MVRRLMVLPPLARKVVLVAHVVTSVGWLGAAVAYLALDVIATTSGDAGEARSAYLAMDLTVRSTIVPLALAAVTIGILNAFGTPWGLARHYWVVVKLGLTVFAATVLVVESRTVAGLAETAREGGTDPRTLPGTLVHSAGGVLVLVIITVLSVFKPRGLTRYGWRRRQAQQRTDATAALP